MSMSRTIFEPEHEMFRDSARRFFAAEVAPHGERFRAQGYVDPAIFRKAGEQGLLFMWADERFGGAGIRDFRYEQILLEFFRMHDPTTYHRQGNDIGSHYRSAIFYHSEEQRRVAERVKARVAESGAWERPIVTEIVEAGPFFAAEDYHQEYLRKHLRGYICHYVRSLTF